MIEGNHGHGHVFRRPDGVRARCGGPGICPVCSIDLARLAAQAKPRTANSDFETALEEELQATFGRAAEAT